MTKKASLERSSAHSPPQVSGPAAAALISAVLGCFFMMVFHHLGDTSKPVAEFLWKIGSWIPGSETVNTSSGEIDSYYGKETILLVSWLVSWWSLHQFWKDKQIPFSWIFWSFSLLVAATVMAWHPLFPYLKIM
jgi:hypothetical protein